MMVSKTIASVIELLGSATAPVTAMFVVVTFVEVKSVLPKVAIVPTFAMNEVVKRLVELALVKMPVAGVTKPIGVLLMVPPSMVKPLTTMRSVTELVGRVICPVALKLVVVMFVATTFAGLNVVTANVLKKPLVDVSEVPFAVPKERFVELNV